MKRPGCSDQMEGRGELVELTGKEARESRGNEEPATQKGVLSARVVLFFFREQVAILVGRGRRRSRARRNTAKAQTLSLPPFAEGRVPDNDRACIDPQREDPQEQENQQAFGR